MKICSSEYFDSVNEPTNKRSFGRNEHQTQYIETIHTIKKTEKYMKKYNREIKRNNKRIERKERHTKLENCTDSNFSL